MLWDMHLCVFDVRLSFENRVVRCLSYKKNFGCNFNVIMILYLIL